MCRKNLLNDITCLLNKIGFKRNDSGAAYSYKENVKYPSKLLGMKNDYAHFILFTPQGSIQIVAKYQESSGTAIEKLAYTAMDAANSQHAKYLVVCDGQELLKDNRAISFLNAQKQSAPKLHALAIAELEHYLANFIGDKAA